MAPLLTATLIEKLLAARNGGATTLQCSVDLERSIVTVELWVDCWVWQGTRFPYPASYKDRTVYFWQEDAFQPIARFGSALIKLVPTDWGPPTFEIDGIKMLPTAHISPYEDAERKVGLIRPRGKIILDCCGGLGYFAACCLSGAARQVLSFEKNADVIWLRTMNPWSPVANAALSLTQADITQAVTGMPNDSVDAVLHDPPRFGMAGELYSQEFYEQLARVIKRKGRLFHYTGSPNKVARGRDVAGEVSNRLRNAGFAVDRTGDGLLAIKQ
jgi:uncharacterized protein